MAEQNPREERSSSGDSDLSFEQAYAELERTVNALQQGQLSLDETLRLYERGTQLARYCREKLEAVQLKVSQLLSHANGTYSAKAIGSGVPSAESGVPSPGSRVLGRESGVSSPESRVPGLESGAPSPRSGIQSRERGEGGDTEDAEGDVLRAQRELFE